MARKFEDQDGPYEFERPVQTHSRFTSVASGVAGFAIAAGMLSGVAYAVSAATETPQATISSSDQLDASEPADETVADSIVLEDSNDTALADSESSEGVEIATPPSVIKSNFSASDDDDDEGEDEDSDDAFEQEDEHHDEDSAFESEDSEDD